MIEMFSLECFVFEITEEATQLTFKIFFLTFTVLSYILTPHKFAFFYSHLLNASITPYSNAQLIAHHIMGDHCQSFFVRTLEACHL